MFHKLLERGEAGDNLGALVRGLKREEVKRGMILCAPGTVRSHTKFEAQVTSVYSRERERNKALWTRRDWGEKGNTVLHPCLDPIPSRLKNLAAKILPVLISREKQTALSLLA